MFQTVAPIKLGPLALTTSVQTVATVGTKARLLIKNIDVCNTTAGQVTFDIYLVPSGGSAGTGNALLYQAVLPANSLFQWYGTEVLNEGDTLRAKASTTGVTLHASGGEAV